MNVREGLISALAVGCAVVCLSFGVACVPPDDHKKNHAPSVRITSPSGGASFSEDETIGFRAEAVDPEEGVLTGESITWSSDVDGTFGSGESCDTDSLSVNTHNITVTATDSKGKIGIAALNITVLMSRPVAPTAFSAALIDGPAVELVWEDNSLNEAGFKIERAEDGGSYVHVQTTGPDITGWYDTFVQWGHDYRYRVCAYNSGGNSDWAVSETVTIESGGMEPDAPSGLTAAAVSSTRIDLSWTDLSWNESGFRIERKTGAVGSYAIVAEVAANVTEYGDTALAALTTYYYRVCAFNDVGTSGYSNEAGDTTDPPAPVPDNRGGFACGGGRSQSVSFRLRAVVGDAADGTATSPGYDNRAGLVPYLEE